MVLVKKLPEILDRSGDRGGCRRPRGAGRRDDRRLEAGDAAAVALDTALSYLFV
jgi:hypothetical protein